MERKLLLIFFTTFALFSICESLQISTLIDDSFKFVLPVNPLSGRLQEYRHQKKFTDVTIKVGDKKYPSHRIVLEDSSLVLKRLLAKTTKKNDVCELDNQFVHLDIVEDLLTYFYTGEITFTTGKARHVCVASYYLNVSPLLSVCENFLGGRITLSNVLDMLLLSGQLKLENLQKRCVDLLVEAVSSSRLPASFLGNAIGNSSCRIQTSPTTTLLYFFGGLSWTHLSSVSRLNLTDRKWSTMNNMISDRTSYAAGIIETNVYLAGGKSSSNRAIASAEVYDLLTGTTKALPPLPDARHNCAGAVLNDNFYVTGGRNLNHQPTSTVFRYDLRNNEWKSVAPLGKPTCSHQMVAYRNSLFAISGYQTKTVQKYNPKTDQWSSMNNTNFMHNWFNAVIHKDRIYIFSENGAEVYDEDADRWTVLKTPTDLLKKRGMSIVSATGKLWISSGCSTSGYSGSKTFVSYDPLTGSWNKEPDMDTIRGFHMTFALTM